MTRGLLVLMLLGGCSCDSERHAASFSGFVNSTQNLTLPQAVLMVGLLACFVWAVK